MKDGRVLYGRVERKTEKYVRVQVGATFAKTRTLMLRTADIEEHAESAFDAAYTIIESLGDPQDTVEREFLARLAWGQRLDHWIKPLLAGSEVKGEILRPFMDGTKLFRAELGDRWNPRHRVSAEGRSARAALDWLAAHQDDDGRIDADDFMKHDPEGNKTDGAGGGHHGERVPCRFDGAVTGLAMLGWMAAGSTPVSGRYRVAIAKGLQFCNQIVDRGPRGFDQIWNHAFCLQALSEAYWLVRDSTWRVVVSRDIIEQGVRDLVTLQRNGGWRYIPRAASGVPTSAAVGTALGMCLRVGIPVPTEAIDALVAYFDERVDPKSGRSEYHDGAERLGYTPTRSNTAAALVACAFVGHLRKRPQLSKQLAALTRHKPTWKLEFKEVTTKDGRSVRAQIGYLYPYAWYYTDLALQLAGKQGGWRGALRKTLLGAQRQDGAFQGSWDPKGTYSSSGGRAFVTALGALMLLSPVRYDRF